MKKLIILGVLGFILLVGLLWGVGGYNGLVGASLEADKQWAQVQSVYQRRMDLIPNLVQTVAGAANFEKTTLEDVTNARASVGRVNVNANAAPNDAAQLQAFAQAQGQLGSALSRLLVVVEKYPDLKATQNFRDLQAQLEGTENRINVERQRFNDTVQNYNYRTKKFPTVLIANWMGFKEKPYFEAVAGAEKAPEVKFDFGTATKP